jgi:uncharacterized protein (DUF2147 family)
MTFPQFHCPRIFSAALIVIGLATVPVAALAADPTGTWQSTSGESRYKVTYCGDGTQLCAKLTWLRDDAKTPENLQLLGAYVVKGASPTAENKWQGAVRYEGDTYEGNVTLVSSDAMKLSGCKGMFCKSMSFTRL